MKLVRYCVMNFRSVKNSGWIDCDDVTTLVGVNESGKSNLLLALWKLNPARGGEIDILHDMPVSELSTLRNRKNEVKFISAEFEMEKDCAEVISKNTGYKCEEGMRVIVSRFYDGRYEIDFPDGDPEVMICAEKETEQEIEEIELPEGYTFFWDAQYKDQGEAMQAIAKFFPLAFLMLIVILVALFSNFKQPVIILCILPLSLIGVAIGMLLTGFDFGFFPIAGWL